MDVKSKFSTYLISLSIAQIKRETNIYYCPLNYIISACNILNKKNKHPSLMHQIMIAFHTCAVAGRGRPFGSLKAEESPRANIRG